MTTSSTPGEAYLVALRRHLEECQIDIDTLRAILAQRQWTRLERHAAERTLQLLIESCIGLAKHWARQATGSVSGDALSAFERLRDNALIDTQVPWRKIIGLRNVLVHDYLEVDDEIVRDVIIHCHYQALFTFAGHALQALDE